MKFEIHKNEINKVTKELLKRIKEPKDKARMLALYGNLGAGKTTLVQDIAREVGIKEKVVSPTFVIMKIYNLKKSSEYFNLFQKIVHIDAYRLDSYKDLEKIAWASFVNDKNNLIIIEWPEKIKEGLTGEVVSLKLEHIDEETRTFEF